MSIVEPLPSGGYGKADWVDYSNYWREADAEWTMERSILRYATAGARTTQWPSPRYGMTTYNETTDKLETFSKVASAWTTVQSYANLLSTQDTAAGVAISHKDAAGKGIVFQPTQTVLDNPILVMGGVLTVNATGVSIKTGTKTAKLTTSATDLVVDSPITATGATLSGALAGTSATLSGTLTVPNITMSGTLTGGTFKGIVDATTVAASTSGTIGGVAMSSNQAVAPGGFVAEGGNLVGDANSGYIRYRNPSGGAISTSQMTMDATYIRFRVPNGIPLDNAAGAHTGAWIGGAIVSASDPGAANFPNGTIWCS